MARSGTLQQLEHRQMTRGSGTPATRMKRGERTRNALIEAGHRLLSERPIDALAIDDIVQAAGVGKGTFYKHFNDKDALASTIREDVRQKIEAAVMRVNADVTDPAQRVARALSVYTSYVLASRERAATTLRITAGLASTHNPLNQGVLQDVAAGMATGRFKVFSVEVGALHVIGACQIALMRAVEETDRDETKTIAQKLTALLLHGLGVPADQAERISRQAMDELGDLFPKAAYAFGN